MTSPSPLPTDDRDRSIAAALQIAYQNLLRLGWKFSAADVGKHAREILNAFDANGGRMDE